MTINTTQASDRIFRFVTDRDVQDAAKSFIGHIAGATRSLLAIVERGRILR